ncbi:MAG: phage terminase large subunit, partial [Clostridia bacterium]|nr:phage terminase large subunit [Clostridia bacterium]
NTVSPMEMCFLPTGQKILFRGFDDVLKLASATVSHGVLNFVWIEEAFEIEREEDFYKLDLSVPRGQTPEGLFKQTTLTFNPWSASHWLKKRFFDTPSPDTSTFTTDYRCNEFLDSTDLAVFARMEKTNRRKYEVAGLGNWGISEGLVFENWQTAVKDIPDDELYMWKSFYGLDYGYSNDPTAFIAFKVNPLSREIYVFDEFCRKRMLNRDIAAEIIRRGYAKERIRADAAEPKSNEDLRRMGISRICPSQKGPDSILHGIAEINEYRIFVHPACVNTARELSNYVYETKPTAAGQIMPADRDNHLCDAMRYAFCDVKFFKPVKEKPNRSTPYLTGITAADFKA